MKLHKYLIVLSIICLTLFLSGCANTVTKQEEPPIRLGVTIGPMEDIANEVAKEGQTQGLNIKVIPYDNFNDINKDLVDGKLDANNYQNEAYMEYYNKKNHTDLYYVNNTLIFRMGLYSKTIPSLERIPTGATVVIPKDRVNHARALNILQEVGLITLDKESVGYPTCSDILSNPKNLKITSMDSDKLPDALNHNDLAIIPMSFLLNSGLDLEKIGLYLEPTNVNLANLGLVTTSANKQNPNLQKIIGLFHSDRVKKLLKERYNDVILTS